MIHLQSTLLRQYISNKPKFCSGCQYEEVGLDNVSAQQELGIKDSQNVYDQIDRIPTVDKQYENMIIWSMFLFYQRMIYIYGVNIQHGQINIATKLCIIICIFQPISVQETENSSLSHI